jgi:tRNA(Leu) C34 or U34 (ribose-2'-O)-methylase TrmL
MESVLSIKKPDFYLLIYNIAKSKNIGTLIRSASAFGVKQIFILGQNKKVIKKFFGSQGTINKSEFLFFDDIPQLITHCKENDIHLCGVEIGKSSKPIQNYQFKGNTLFLLGNEGQGMNNKQKDLCGDNLVYIPQYTEKTASLNVACAGTIIFHHFALWAGYQETVVTEEKFNVGTNFRLGINFKSKQDKESSSLNSPSKELEKQDIIEGFMLDEVDQNSNDSKQEDNVISSTSDKNI